MTMVVKVLYQEEVMQISEHSKTNRLIEKMEDNMVKVGIYLD